MGGRGSPCDKEGIDSLMIGYSNSGSKPLWSCLENLLF